MYQCLKRGSCYKLATRLYGVSYTLNTPNKSHSDEVFKVEDQINYKNVYLSGVFANFHHSNQLSCRYLYAKFSGYFVGILKGKGERQQKFTDFLLTNFFHVVFFLNLLIV